MLRTELEVLLKYSLNLVEEPEVAAVAAVLARLAHWDRAVRSEESWELEQLLVLRTVRFSRESGLATAYAMDLAAAPSMAMSSLLLEYDSTSAVNSVALSSA